MLKNPEVLSDSNNQAVSLKCTDYPYIIKALGKEQEKSEEEVRKSTLIEEKEESPKGKRCKISS